MPLAISIEQMEKCVERELGFRRGVYPRWVSQGKMRPEKAAEELERMAAVLEALQELRLARAFSQARESHGIESRIAMDAWAAWIAPRHAPLTLGQKVG
jgi:hypothetical protein